MNKLLKMKAFIGNCKHRRYDGILERVVGKEITPQYQASIYGKVHRDLYYLD